MLDIFIIIIFRLSSLRRVTHEHIQTAFNQKYGIDKKMNSNKGANIISRGHIYPKSAESLRSCFRTYQNEARK